MLDEAKIEAIVNLVGEQGLDEACVSKLRESFSGTHFTYCMDDDMNGSRPYHTGKGFNLYLVSSSNHCSTLTPSLESASGIVLAEVIDD